MPRRSQTSGTRDRCPAGIPASMSSSFSFFSPASPSGLKRSPGRRPRTVNGGWNLARSRATRSGSAPNFLGSKPAGRRIARAVRIPPPGSVTLPGTASGEAGGDAPSRAAAAREMSSPEPSRRAATPPGRSHLRLPGPVASNASTWRPEKSARAAAASRSADSSARDSTAGGVSASRRGGNR